LLFILLHIVLWCQATGCCCQPVGWHQLRRRELARVRGGLRCSQLTRI
jgi:hypothetical protein